ncbi:MAG: 50S ribosomal protein L16 [Methanobacteriota archaeon]|nr:MAG: 50S ribosomal protein L16 [Euryarchaeota archaeon]
MPLRPAKSYRNYYTRPYTRREFVRSVPGLKIVHFEMGNVSGDFDTCLHLVACESVQIRHNALEAARVAANRYLSKRTGSMGFKLKIYPYPHQILRENPMMTGAGADRVQDGMRKAFGKAIGAAAKVKAGQRIMSVHISRKDLVHGKEALRRAGMKLPTPCRIMVETFEKAVA